MNVVGKLLHHSVDLQPCLECQQVAVHVNTSDQACGKYSAVHFKDMVSQGSSALYAIRQQCQSAPSDTMLQGKSSHTSQIREAHLTDKG